MVFSRAPTEKFPSSSLNELTRIISNDDGVFNYFIKMKDYVVKTTRSLRDEWNSRNTLYSLRKGSQVVYFNLIVTGAVDHELQRIEYKFKETKDITPTTEKVSCEYRLFSKMNFVTCRSTYHSSCYRIESRTSKNSDELRTGIEKAYVVVTYSVCKAIIWVSSDKHSTNSYST